MCSPEPDTLRLSIDELCDRIEALTTNMMEFWRSAHGWAPVEAAGLLSTSMLDWQASLSTSLHRWTTASSTGDLILAWANLGALIEGQLKLFLSVYYHDYSNDVEAIRDKRRKLVDLDGLSLEPLRQFFVRRIWTSGTNWNPYVERIQRRRNAIHAFRSREIGTFEDWKSELPRHLSFVRDINRCLPYPDDIYVPREL